MQINGTPIITYILFSRKNIRIFINQNLCERMLEHWMHLPSAVSKIRRKQRPNTNFKLEATDERKTSWGNLKTRIIMLRKHWWLTIANQMLYYFSFFFQCADQRWITLHSSIGPAHWTAGSTNPFATAAAVICSGFSHAPTSTAAAAAADQPTHEMAQFTAG